MRLSTRLSVVMVGLVLLTAAAIGFLSYRNLEEVTLQGSLERKKSRVTRLAGELDAYVDSAGADVLVARKLAAIDQFVRASVSLANGKSRLDVSTTKWAEAVTALFVAELSVKPSYLQYRLIGIENDGRELIRVDRSGDDGAIRVVPTSELQPKGGRDYVRETLQVPDGSVYISPIELNRERGAIEIPHTPVLRVATPIVRPDGQRFGVLVINVDMRRAFENLRQSHRAGGEVFVVNHNGDYLVHSDRQKEFRFDFGDSARWHDDLPECVEQFSGNAIAGVFSDSVGNRHFVGASAVRLAGVRELIVVESVPYSLVTETTAILRNSVIVAGFCSAVFAGILAVVFSQRTARPMERLAASVSAFTGRESVAVPVSSNREMRDLSTAVETMTEGVKRRIESLRMQTLESAPVAVVMIDKKGAIAFSNTMASRMFGYEPDELVGQPVELLVPNDVAALHVERRNLYLSNPQQRAMGAGRDLHGRRKDGTAFPVEIGLNPIEAEHELLVISVIVDLSDRKRLESDLSLANETLERRSCELQRSNQDLEQFAYVASHDLQEPLRKVASCCQVLADDYADKLDDDGREWVEFAVDGANRMRRLVIDLLDFSRIGTASHEFEITDANQACASALENLADAIEQRNALVTCCPLPRVVVGEIQLTRLFQNLIGNSIKYCEEDRPVIEVDAVADGDRWKFSIKDNGIGIEPEFHERIFQIFQRLHRKEEYTGTGVGLAICRKIVERFDGKLWVESHSGKGSTFCFTFPSADSTNESSEPQ